MDINVRALTSFLSVAKIRGIGPMSMTPPPLIFLSPLFRGERNISRRARIVTRKPVIMRIVPMLEINW